MALTTNGLDWLAQNAGIGNCFASSGISYKDADGDSYTGGTKDVVNAFTTAHVVGGKDDVIIIAGTSYNMFKSINDGVDLVYTDVGEAADREADGGTYPKYCYSATCTPGTKRCRDSKTVEQCRGDGSGWDVVQTCGAGYECRAGACVPVTVGDLEGFVGTFDFGKVCVGDPEGSIDVSTVTMGQEYNPTAGKSVFWLSHSKVANTGTAAAGTDCPMWIALELRLWAGTHVECGPTGIPDAWKGVNINTDEGWMIIFPIDAGTTEEIYAHFYVPDSIKGIHTLCLYVWANFSKSALYDELEVAGYTNPP